MSAVFTRILKFKTMDLGTDATLLLTFNKISDGMYHDKFPICWKVVKFASTGPNLAAVTYRSQLAFSKPRIDHPSDTVVPVDASTYQPINLGQKTTLIQDDNGDYKFTPPEADLGDNIKAFNGTDHKETMAIGFLGKNSVAPTPVLVFDGVGTGSSVKAQFTPVLHAYITGKYQETQIIRGEIESPLLWEQDLALLTNDTVWDINYDTVSRTFSILPSE